MKNIFLIILINIFTITAYSQNPEISILFIGNSLTNGNSSNINDPTTGNSIAYNFRGLAMEAGFNVHVEMYAPNGVYVYDDPNNSSNIGHCNRTTTENLINSRQWDYIFVQDNVGSYMWSEGYFSSFVISSNNQLHNKIITNNPCTKEIFYSAQGYYDGLPSAYWHSGGLNLSYDNNIEATIRSYLNSNYLNNNTIGGIVTPAGLAWNRYCNDGHSRNDLYYDTAHPTAKGAYLSGATVFCTVFKMNPTNINWDNGFTDAQYLRQIAYETVIDNAIFTQTNLDTYTPELSFNNNEISVNNTYSSYQWYNSPNQITGATNQTYTISQTNLYFAEVTDVNGCKLRSKIDNYDFSTNVNINITDNINIYPNPANSTIKLTGLENNVQIQIINLQGQVIKKVYNTNFIDINNLANGNYIIKIITNKEVINKMLQKN